MALSKALRRLDADTCSPDDRLYAIEHCKGSRSYLIMSPSKAWIKTSEKGPKHLYEVLSGPCDMYLDVEWVAMEQVALAEQKKRVKQIVDHVCGELQRAYQEVHPQVTSVTASGWKPNGEYKCSWHIHVACTGICWANSLAVGQFVRAKCAHLPEVDKVPYSAVGQNWRCVGSAKASEPLRKFVPDDQDTFMACTVQQPVRARSIIYPDVDVSMPLSDPVPPAIAALAWSLEPGGIARMVAQDRCVVPFAKRQYCEHAGRTHRSNHQYAVINLNTLMWKMGCHACPDAIGTWQPFSDQTLVAAAFAEQCTHLDGTCAAPPMRKMSEQEQMMNVCAADADLRVIGPPRARAGVVACRDGIYCCTHE